MTSSNAAAPLGANAVQVGGEHYRKNKTYMADTPDGRKVEVLVPQHWDIVAMHGLDYFQGNISKYIFRWRDKDGLRDLMKSRHYIDKYIEMNGGEPTVDISLRFTPEQMEQIVRAHEQGGTAEPGPARDFMADITRFNEMYGLPRPKMPTAADVHAHYEGGLLRRLEDFHSILIDELSEISEVQDKLRRGMPATHIDILVELADWFGDIVVYVASEARKFGLPLTDILHAIMDSNFSKLGEDGKPLVNESGKVLKGPNYQPPEPALRKLLVARLLENLTDSVLEPIVEDLSEEGPQASPPPEQPDYVAKAAHDKVEAARLGMTVEGWWGDGTQLYKDESSRHTVRAASAGEARKLLDAVKPS